MNFPEQVLFARAKLNLTQKSFGDLLGVKLLTVSRWERGKTKPRKKDLMRFYCVCKDSGIVFNAQGDIHD